MRRGVRFPGIGLAIAAIALLPAPAAASPAGAAEGAKAAASAAPATGGTGVPLEVQISPVSSQTRVVVHFTGAKASGWIKAHPGSEALAAGARFNGNV